MYTKGEALLHVLEQASTASVALKEGFTLSHLVL